MLYNGSNLMAMRLHIWPEMTRHALAGTDNVDMAFVLIVVGRKVETVLGGD